VGGEIHQPLPRQRASEPSPPGPADWASFRSRWSRLRPPLRPTAETVAAQAAAIERHDARVLLLGVTPELYALGRDLTAVDHSPEMIAGIWPGDRRDRRAVLDDWRTMAPCWGPFTAACGDGSLNALGWPDDARAVLARLEQLLAPGARLAIRCYLAPDRPETVDEVRKAALAGEVRGFHASKLRLAMARPDPSGGPRVAVAAIAEAFDRAFPDRAALARAAGWSLDEIAEIDAYRGSSLVYGFPTRWELLGRLRPGFAGARLVAAGRYELAERCPILVAERTG
jgi:hypothetical protein